MESALEPAGKAVPTPSAYAPRKPLLLCLSHLRWDFVFQRPQHVLTRAARHFDVIYIEEPIETEGALAHWSTAMRDNVSVLTPVLPPGLPERDRHLVLQRLIERLLGGRKVAVAWYYTPMALGFTRQLRADVIVYDNMDELALFHGADSRMLHLEKDLLARADLVFTGGQSLYEAKRHRHTNIHAVPSSVDSGHFSARAAREPGDLAAIPHPRVGFFGVIDERMDMALLDSVAAVRSDLQFIMVGPTAKIDPADRPDRSNIHWLGPKLYEELPAYLQHWDCGFMPFARNDATRFISPTKTPEFLAAGLPIVSTPIHDVVHPYGERGLVEIGSTAAEISAGFDRAMAARRSRAWRDKVQQQLALSSWDRTWAFMHGRVAALRPIAQEEAHA